jgi:TIR domain
MTKPHQYFLSARPALTMGPAPVGGEVGRAVHHDDEHRQPFFLSYAHTAERQTRAARSPSPDRHIEKFFQDLEENVRQLIPLQADEPAGFMDQEIRGGMRWTDELIHAVGTCQVLVALLSSHYLSSEWCRMEWRAFARRGVQGVDGAKASPRQGCIVPVRWAPFHEELPRHISQVQIFSPDRDPAPRAPDHYGKNGVLGLIRMKRLRESYEIVTWQLAMHIAHMFHSQRTEPRRFELAELRIVSHGDGHDC